MNTKRCTKCQEEKELSEFNKHKNTKDGLAPNCKKCHNKMTRDWYRRNKESRKKSNRKWIENNRERWNELRRNNYHKNVERSRMLGLKSVNRRSRYLRHKLSELFKPELDKIYKERPEGFHVDHIIPLQGENVCGLHVPWNLQYLPASENLSKSNKFNKT